MTWAPLSFQTPATPESIYGSDLVQHVRADDYTPGTWPDSSGNNYDYVQATGADRPTQNLTGGSNNRAYLAFDGTSDYMTLASSMGSFGVDPDDSQRVEMTVFIVGRVKTGCGGNSAVMVATDGVNSDFNFATSPDCGAVWLANSADDIYGFGGHGGTDSAKLTSVSQAFDTWYLMTYASKAGKWLVRRTNGVEISSATGTGAPAASNPSLWALGCRLIPTPLLFAKIDISEIIVARSTNDERMIQVENLLLSYYDL